MPIDASIALGQPAPSLIQSLGQATALKGQMLQQNQLTQQMAANKATSAAMQQAYDPTTGRVDTNKLAAIMSQDPAAAYNLLPTQNAILENQQKQTGIDTANFDLGLKRNTYFVNQFAGLANKPNPTADDILNIGVGAVKQGLMSPDEVVRHLQNSPKDSKDPAQIKAWAQQNLRQSMINASQYAGVLPQNSQVGTGNATHFVSTDPITGRPQDMGQLQQNMAPGDANSLITIPDENGKPRMFTKEQAAQMANGSAPQARGGYTPDTSGGPLGTGRLQPMAAPQQPQGIPAGPALGTAEAAGVLGKGQGEDILALRKQAESAQQAVYQFQNMRSALADINTGPGADMRNTAAAFATMLSPDIAQRFGVDPQKIASQEEFHKFATQATQATLQGLGNGTDSMLASAVSANPNTSLSKLGNQQILDVLQAGQQAIIAKNQAWQEKMANGTAPSEFNKFSTQWTKDIDPRVFAAQNMDPAARYKMLDSLPKKDQEAFKQSWLKARNAGYVQ